MTQKNLSKEEEDQMSSPVRIYFHRMGNALLSASILVTVLISAGIIATLIIFTS